VTIQRTSIEAKEKIEPKIGSLRRKVYELFINRGLDGLTDQEIEKYLHLDGNTVRPIRGSLVTDGFVIDSGTTRNNEKGNRCIVWRHAENGMML
jgi:transcription initiation factor IIE alpha subunit